MTDNFKGQITSAVMNLLEAHNVHVCFLSPNTTDFATIDRFVCKQTNKPSKDFLKRRFDEWYSREVMKQLEGRDNDSTDIEPIKLALPLLTEFGTR